MPKKTGSPRSIPTPESDPQPSTASRVEQTALEKSGYALIYPPEERIGSIIVENFPSLGKLAAVRFLEWVQENPEGVISLPTGKTPEYFIKFVQHFLKNWDRREVRQTLEGLGLDTSRRPRTEGLQFVQIDEFYPIDSSQHNSFYHYVKRFYIKGFKLDPTRAMLINPNRIGIPAGSALPDIFPEMKIDLSLRVRRPTTVLEKTQQDVLEEVDQFCTDYEARIRALGGIGFFLGGIGPDGHIAFNVRGTDHFSTTRLTEPNYETRAAAATDLGGIEVARNKQVITIGLATITHNPDAVAIIFAAGEGKARVVARTIESPPCNRYPGSALAVLPRARFYLTRGASCRLRNRIFLDFQRKPEASGEDVSRIVMDLSLETGKLLRDLSGADFQQDRMGRELVRKTGRPFSTLVRETEDRLRENIRLGNLPIENRTFLHTAPHHDDIILAYLPYFTHLVRRSSTKHFFAYLTSGFTAVTNGFMLHSVQELIQLLERGAFDGLLKTDYFDPDNERARQIDTSHYLEGTARHNPDREREARARRFLRNMIELYEDDGIENIRQRLEELAHYFRTQYPGKKDITIVQQLKGRMREFESDLKWAYFGFTGRVVRHLRLGFYQGDIFTERPTVDRDVPPVLNLLHEVNPDLVTVAFDPEGAGPDTHYKVLQATSAALRMYEEQSGNHSVRVLGYRNVWYRFHPSECNRMVPASMRHINDMEECFETCFATQRAASFPSWEFDGPFSKLARKIQVKQYEQVKTFLGEDFFLSNDDHILRSCCAMVYLKEMSLEEFYSKSEELRKYAEEV